jgi:hypothetical protein
MNKLCFGIDKRLAVSCLHFPFPFISFRTEDSAVTYVLDDQEFVAQKPFSGSFFVPQKTMIRAGFQMVERAVMQADSFGFSSLKFSWCWLSCVHASVFPSTRFSSQFRFWWN